MIAGEALLVSIAAVVCSRAGQRRRSSARTGPLHAEPGCCPWGSTSSSAGSRSSPDSPQRSSPPSSRRSRAHGARHGSARPTPSARPAVRRGRSRCSEGSPVWPSSPPESRCSPPRAAAAKAVPRQQRWSGCSPCRYSGPSWRGRLPGLIGLAVVRAQSRARHARGRERACEPPPRRLGRDAADAGRLPRLHDLLRQDDPPAANDRADRAADDGRLRPPRPGCTRAARGHRSSREARTRGRSGVRLVPDLGDRRGRRHQSPLVPGPRSRCKHARRGDRPRRHLGLAGGAPRARSRRQHRQREAVRLAQQATTSPCDSGTGHSAILRVVADLRPASRVRRRRAATLPGRATRHRVLRRRRLRQEHSRDRPASPRRRPRTARASEPCDRDHHTRAVREPARGRRAPSSHSPSTSSSVSSSSSAPSRLSTR